MLPGMELVEGAVDNHVHACPHLNARSVTVFGAARQAAAAGMRAIGLMDNFCNSAGYAALAMRELADLGIEVFGGLIMEPQAGGIALEAVEAALGYGYGRAGARFVSLPTHHTRHMARIEGRSPAYVEACFAAPERGRAARIPCPRSSIASPRTTSSLTLATSPAPRRCASWSMRAGAASPLFSCRAPITGRTRCRRSRLRARSPNSRSSS